MQNPLSDSFLESLKTRKIESIVVPKYKPNMSLRIRAKLRKHPYTLQDQKFFKSRNRLGDFYAMWRAIGDEVIKEYISQVGPIPWEHYTTGKTKKYRPINWYDLKLGDVGSKLRIYMKEFDNPQWEEWALERMFKRNLDSMIDELDLAFAIKCFKLLQTNPNKLVSRAKLEDKYLEKIVSKVRATIEKSKTSAKRSGETRRRTVYDLSEYLSHTGGWKITSQQMADLWGVSLTTANRIKRDYRVYQATLTDRIDLVSPKRIKSDYENKSKE